MMLKKYGISANKSLGQNFLINDEVVTNIVERANISDEDLVLEMIKNGNVVGNHTVNHKCIAKISDEEILNIIRFYFISLLYNNLNKIVIYKIS